MSSNYLYVSCTECDEREHVYAGELFSEHFYLDEESIEMKCNACISKGAA